MLGTQFKLTTLKMRMIYEFKSQDDERTYKNEKTSTMQTREKKSIHSTIDDLKIKAKNMKDALSRYSHGTN